MPKSVFQLHQLNKNVVLGIQPRRGLGRFKVERKPLLHALHSRSLSEIEEQREVKDDRRRQDRITTEKVDLDLHRITKPAEDVDIVPTFFVVATRGIVVDSHNM